MRVYDFRLPIFDCHKNQALSETFTGHSGPPAGWTRPVASSDSSLCVAGVVALNAFWKKTLASALSTPCESRSSAFGAHARAKPVLALASPFRWLISAFHKTEKFARRELRAVTLGWERVLSI